MDVALLFKIEPLLETRQVTVQRSSFLKHAALVYQAKSPFTWAKVVPCWRVILSADFYRAFIWRNVVSASRVTFVCPLVHVKALT